MSTEGLLNTFFESPGDFQPTFSCSSGVCYKLSQFSHQETLQPPNSWSELDSVDLFEKMRFAKSLDSGFFFLNTIGTFLIERLERLITQKALSYGYLPLRFPVIHRESWIEPSGVLERFDKEIFKLSSPQNFVVAATTEELLLKYLSDGGLTSYRQLPLRFHAINHVHRDIPRAEGFYSTRQILTCVLPRLSIDLESYKEGILEFEKLCVEIFSELGLSTQSVFADDDSAVEIFIKLPRSDRRISESISARKGFQESQNCSEVEPERLTSLAMAYPFKSVDKYGINCIAPSGERVTPLMSTAGIGIQRLLLSIFDVHRDDEGINLPQSLQPFDVFVTEVNPQKFDPNSLSGNELVEMLTRLGANVVFDDRSHLTLAQRLVFPDFYGIRHRIIVGPKEASERAFELRLRGDSLRRRISMDDLVEVFKFTE